MCQVCFPLPCETESSICVAPHRTHMPSTHSAAPAHPVARADRRGSRAPQNPAVAAPRGLSEEVGFRAEVVVYESGVDVYPRGDRPDRHAVIPMLCDLGQSRGQDPLAQIRSALRPTLPTCLGYGLSLDAPPILQSPTISTTAQRVPTSAEPPGTCLRQPSREPPRSPRAPHSRRPRSPRRASC